MFKEIKTFGASCRVNRDVILRLLASEGPAEFYQIAYECAAQGYPQLNVIDSALRTLIEDRVVVAMLVEPQIEGDDLYFVYDIA